MTQYRKKVKNREAVGLVKILPEVWMVRKVDEIPVELYNAVYKQNKIDKSTIGCILLFPKKGGFGIIKNCTGITLTTISAKFHNALLLILSNLKLRKFLVKIKTALKEIGSQLFRFRETIESREEY